MADDTRGPLRERKRRDAMLRAQAAALDLFEARGFDAVTIEEIADASDVSTSSIYRYFGTKENLVLWDAFDPDAERMLAVAMAEPVPLEGIRRVFVANLATLTPADEHQIRRRTALMMTNPAIEQAATGLTYSVAELLGRVMAERMDRPMVDLEIQVVSHALSGAILGIVHHWYGTGFAAPLSEVLDTGLDLLARGLSSVTQRHPAPEGRRPPR